MNCNRFSLVLTRRDMLRVSGAGFGSLALAGLCQNEVHAAGPLTPRQPPFPARAKRVIFLFMHGGPSQMDTFDYKPQLTKDHGKPLPFDKPRVFSAETGNLLGLLAALAVTCQILFVGRLIRRFGEPLLLKFGLPSVAMCLLAWGLVREQREFYLVIAAMAVLASTLNVSLRSRLTKLADPNETGRLLGYQTSIESAARVLGPLSGAALMEWGNSHYPGIFAGILLLALLPLLSRSWKVTD